MTIHRLRVTASSTGFLAGALCYVMASKKGQGGPRKTTRFIESIEGLILTTNQGERFSTLTLEQIFEGEAEPVGRQALPLPSASRAWIIKTDVRYIRKFESGRNFTVIKKSPFLSEVRKVATIEAGFIFTTNGEIYDSETGRQTGIQNYEYLLG